MAIKDEYEVARLLTEAAFTTKLNSIGGDNPNPSLPPCSYSFLMKDGNGLPRKNPHWPLDYASVTRFCRSGLGFVKAGLTRLDLAVIKEPNAHSVIPLSNWIKALGNMATSGRRQILKRSLISCCSCAAMAISKQEIMPNLNHKLLRC